MQVENDSEAWEKNLGVIETSYLIVAEFPS